MRVKLTFRVRTPVQAETAELLGDFTNWQERPISMKKVRDGLFQVKVRLAAPHRYQYRFKVDDKWKETLDDGAPATGTVPTPYNSRNYFIDLPARKASILPLITGRRKASGERRPDTLGHDLNQEAHQLLKKCAAAGDISKWNQWREENPGELSLEGIDLTGACLKNANLSRTQLSKSCLQKANLYGADLRFSYLMEADMLECNLGEAKLDNSDIKGAKLQGASMIHASFLGTYARYTCLHRADLHHAVLRGADFSYAIVDGETLLDTMEIDRNTDFTSVGLSSARLKPGLIDTLSYNTRRKRWHEWYASGSVPLRLLKRALAQPFWLISDYGRSTSRILLVFLAIAFTFAVIYGLKPDAISGLGEQPDAVNYFRTVYFSVATMVTLGFGDMNARPGSLLGNTAVMVQILSGYLILAALVTRISVLFSSGGPALPLKKTYRRDLRTP